MKNNYLVLVWIFLAVVIISLVVPVFAVQGSPQYGIILSKSCLTMLSNNITTACPTYEEIAVLFPDNTNQKTSGKFDYKDGIWQRGQPKIFNPIQEYVFRPTSTLWIDPPGIVLNQIDIITILPSVPEYKIPINSTRMDDYNITFGVDRWINPNCSEIKITAKDWIYLTGDSLNLLSHNCDLSYSSFNGTVTHYFEKSYQDFTMSSKYKLEEFIKAAKIKYSVSQIGKDINENRAVTTDEDER